MTDVLPILVTRPQPAASETASQLRSLNYEVFEAPLFDLEAVPFDKKIVPSVEGLIFTSAHAVEFFAPTQNPSPPLSQVERPQPVFAIGPRTAAAAKAAGFSNITQFDGDRDGLIAAIASNFSGRTLLHPRGAHHAGNIAGALQKRGIAASDLVVYEARAVPTLPQSARKFLTLERGIVLFFSRRAAETFTDLTRRSGEQGGTSNLIGLCLSDQVALGLKTDQWMRIYSSKTPSVAGILTILSTL